MTRRIRQTLEEAARLDMRLLAEATEDQQRRVFKNATTERLLKLDAHFENWAHEKQLPPPCEGWRVWLMMAGRGFGKTRAGAEWIFRLAQARPKSLIALVGANIDDARTVMVEGVSGLLSVAERHGRKLKWEPSLGRLSWPNGSQAQLFSGDNPDGLRGPEHDFAWADELAKWRLAQEAWDNLQFGLRRGPRPRVLVTTTPRSMPRLLRGRGGTEWAIGSHQSSEWFALVGDGNSAKLSLPPWVKGASASVAPAGNPDDPVVTLVGGEALRPPTPVQLAGGLDSSGSLSLDWIRRSRNGWAWVDEVDAPLGESAEQYRVTIVGNAGLIEAISFVPHIEIPASDLAGAGAGAAAVEVRQIGDFAASRPASISIILS